MHKALFLIFSATCSFLVFWNIKEWPVYFFCDEAVFAKQAYNLLSSQNTPNFYLYHEIAGGRYTPILSSYLLLPFTYFFGFSAEIARTASAFWALFAIYWMSKTAKDFFAPKVWFLVPIIFLAIPSWFLHARTAFDMSISISFLSAGLYFYLKYRLANPNYIYGFVIAISGYFYVYASSQIIAPLICLALFFSDFRYHYLNRIILFKALSLGLVLSIPAISFTLSPANGFNGQISSLNSFLIQNLSITEKISIFFKSYLEAFSPSFWLSTHFEGITRHRIKGYGYIPVTLVPFFIFGTLLCITRIRETTNRCLLILLLVLPIPAALVGQSATRTVCMLIPFIAISCLGINLIINRYSKLIYLFAVVILTQSLHMSVSALSQWKTWESEYGFYGLQWGTRNLFEEFIPELSKRFPDNNIYLTPHFANNAEALADFYRNTKGNQKMSLKNFSILEKEIFSENDIFIALDDEYTNLIKSGLFKRINLIDSIYFPDNQVGFRVFNLSYKDEIDQILADRKLARSIPEKTAVVLNGQNLSISHSRIDMGQIQDIFDKNIRSVMRGLEANPFYLEIKSDQAIYLNKLGFNLGNLNALIKLESFHQNNKILSVEQNLEPTLNTDLTYIDTEKLKAEGNQFANVDTIKIWIKNRNNDLSDHIHIFEIDFGL